MKGNGASSWSTDADKGHSGQPLGKHMPEPHVGVHQEEWCCIHTVRAWKGVVESQAWAGGHSHQRQGRVPTG